MRLRSTKILAAVAATVLAASLAACSGGAAGSGGSAGAGASAAGSDTLVIGTGGVFTTNNNPFTPTSSAVANGWNWLIYEPLAMVNTVDPTKQPQPWLASKTVWSKDFRSVTFTARDGVTWSDGQPFTAADIAYTFTLLKNTPALNTGAVDYRSITTQGSDVTVTFGVSQFVNQSKVLSQFIVPEHVWKSVADPATDPVTAPVGTGPFLFQSSTSSVAKLTKNPKYWQADKVEVGAVTYQALQGNDALTNALAAHTIDWAASFSLNVKSGFLDKDPARNAAWNAPQLSVHTFFINTAKKPFDDVHLREAITYAIDRSQASKLATADQFAPITSVTGLPQPIGDSFIAPAYQGQTIGPDLDKAKAALTEGGYTLADGVLKDPSGTPVTMQLTDPAGYTDYLTELQVIGQNLQSIGIRTTLTTPSADAWGAAVASGDFEGTMHWSNSGATPYDLYASWMDGSLVKPLGTPVTGNFGRFSDDTATAALKSYASASDDATRTTALATLQKVVAEKYPVVPLVTAPAIGLTTTVRWKGWPSEENPYAAPGILGPNVLAILTTLQPA